MTIIEIRPFRNGWQVHESAGVQPVFLNQEDAVDYGIGRVCFRSGEICILDETDHVGQMLVFDETNRISE